jgi:hypothetical protein
MTIKQYGGVFGRNPTFNNVTIEGTLTFDGDIDINSDLTIGGNLDVTGSVTADGLTVDGRTDLRGGATPLGVYRTLALGVDTQSEIVLGSQDLSNNYVDAAKIRGLLKANKTDGELSLYTLSSSTLTPRLNIAFNGDISFYNDAAAQALFWDSSASALGLGTTTPSRLAHLYGTSNPALRLDNGTNTVDIGIATSNGALLNGSSTNDLVIARNGAYNIKFGTNGNTRAVIDASGNLLVGTTVAANQGVTIYGNGANGLYSKTTSTSAYWITNDGLTSATGTLFTFYNNTTSCGGITITSTNVTNYNSVSDERLKENIADADDAGSKIDSIQVRKFDWKSGGEHQDYGFIAQELLEVAPVAVSVPEDPEEMMSVDPAKLVPMMLKEIQSLRARVAQLES